MHGYTERAAPKSPSTQRSPYLLRWHIPDFNNAVPSLVPRLYARPVPVSAWSQNNGSGYKGGSGVISYAKCAGRPSTYKSLSCTRARDRKMVTGISCIGPSLRWLLHTQDSVQLIYYCFTAFRTKLSKETASKTSLLVMVCEECYSKLYVVPRFWVVLEQCHWIDLDICTKRLVCQKWWVWWCNN